MILDMSQFLWPVSLQVRRICIFNVYPDRTVSLQSWNESFLLMGNIALSQHYNVCFTFEVQSPKSLDYWKPITYQMHQRLCYRTLHYTPKLFIDSSLRWFHHMQTISRLLHMVWFLWQENIVFLGIWSLLCCARISFTLLDFKSDHIKLFLFPWPLLPRLNHSMFSLFVEWRVCIPCSIILHTWVCDRSWSKVYVLAIICDPNHEQTFSSRTQALYMMFYNHHVPCKQ